MGFIYLNKLKDISLKNMLSTRLYYSSIMDSFTNEIIQDEPYTIIQSFQVNSDTHLHHAHNIPNIIILISVVIVCIVYKYRHIDTMDKLKRLDNFIEYYSIRKKINILLTIMSILFIKNVENAF
jgi:hypothetical protein